jgi:acetylornithine deacetylase/succinyl-diaminopimelate desuccinylase-like protein
MAEWLERRLARTFDQVERIPVPGHGPVLLAELRGSGPGRLLIYTHYDVQPSGPEDRWSVPPFDGVVRDGELIVRGCCDDKADVTSRLQAIDAWLARLDGPPPYSIVWLGEGAEEIGSPGLGEVLAANRDRLQADGCLWESYVRRSDGRPEIGFGSRGVLAVELSVRTMPGDQHAAFAPLLRSAPMILVQALASLADVQGNAAIAGFDDGVPAPTPEEESAAQGIDPPTTEFGEHALLPLPPRELARRLLFSAPVNISGLSAGAVGAEARSAVPAEARAHVDVHTLPGQDADRLFGQIRTHLDAHGFEMVELRLVTKVPPAKGPMDSPLALAALGASRDVFGEPVRYPVVPGAGPAHLVVDTLGIPVVSPAGTTRLSSNIHGFDEHGSLDDYLEHVAFNIRVFERLADELA